MSRPLEGEAPAFWEKKHIAVPHRDAHTDVMVHAGNYCGRIVPLCRGCYISAAQQDDRELMIHDGEEILKPSVCTECDTGNIWWARVENRIMRKKVTVGTTSCHPALIPLLPLFTAESDVVRL